MLPDSHDEPSPSPQYTVRVGVSTAVRLKFVKPPRGIRLGKGAMLGTAMPEAAVNENCNPRGDEDEVSASPSAGHDCAVDVIAEPLGVKQST